MILATVRSPVRSHDRPSVRPIAPATIRPCAAASARSSDCPSARPSVRPSVGRRHILPTCTTVIELTSLIALIGIVYTIVTKAAARGCRRGSPVRATVRPPVPIFWSLGAVISIGVLQSLAHLILGRARVFDGGEDGWQ